MRLTKNQKEYIRMIRNAVRSVKGLLKKSDDYGFFQLNKDVLPISEKAFTKGYRLTKEEILKSAPDRITKKTLENLSNRKVRSRLDFVVTEDVGKYGSGEIVRGTQRDFVGTAYKKEQKEKKRNIPTPKPVPVENEKSFLGDPTPITEQSMVIDHFLSEFRDTGLYGMISDSINELKNKVGEKALGDVLRVLDKNYFWSVLEAHYQDSDGGVAEFMQRVIDELPEEVFDEETKDALRNLAEGDEMI